MGFRGKILVRRLTVREMARDIAFDPGDRALAADFVELISRSDRAVPVHVDMQALAQLVKAVLELGGRH